MVVPATPDNLRRAAALIRGGEVVAFPTETVYGLGADATNAVAVAKLFEIKARPSFDPLIVHLAAKEDLPAVAASVPESARFLVERFWPGPLTLVLPKTARVPDIVTAGLPSVAVRVPDHPVALELLRASGRPIAAPSANRFGRVSPTTAEHVAEQLGDSLPLILDGGPCRVGIESTVISFLTTPPRLLRPGGIALEALREVVGTVDIDRGGDERLAPGRSLRHYAPRTPLRLVGSVREIAAADRAGAALLAVAPLDGAAGFAHVEILAPDGDLHRAAANLFAALRRLDGGGYARIYAVSIPERGLGLAIMDRLKRAAMSDEISDERGAMSDER
jgi:L-threonylcarbamoyladenylate synthase